MTTLVTLGCKKIPCHSPTAHCAMSSNQTQHNARHVVIMQSNAVRSIISWCDVSPRAVICCHVSWCHVMSFVCVCATRVWYMFQWMACKVKQGTSLMSDVYSLSMHPASCDSCVCFFCEIPCARWCIVIEIMQCTVIQCNALWCHVIQQEE